MLLVNDVLYTVQGLYRRKLDTEEIYRETDTANGLDRVFYTLATDFLLAKNFT